MTRTHGPLRVVDNCDRGFCMLGSYLMRGTIKCAKRASASYDENTKNCRVSQTSLFSE